MLWHTKDDLQHPREQQYWVKEGKRNHPCFDQGATAVLSWEGFLIVFNLSWDFPQERSKSTSKFPVCR